MAGIQNRPTLKSDPAVIEELEWSTETADAGLTEPSSAHRDDGWAVEKPSRYEWNYMWRRLWTWLRRLVSTAFFIESQTHTVTILAVGAVGYVRSILIGGNQIDYTTNPGDTPDLIAQRWAYAINADPLTRALVRASASAAVMTVVVRKPGTTVAVVTVDVNSVLAATVASPFKVRLSDDDLTNVASLDFVFGSATLDDAGVAAHDARLLFRKAKGAFRAGGASIGQWDDANTGLQSAAWGQDCTASGDQSTAGGAGCTASGPGTVALGWLCTAAGGTAIGTSCVASGLDSVAMGDSCEATAANAVAIGKGAQATGVEAVALGVGLASGAGALATGGSSTASGARARAHGNVSEATGVGAVAEGSAAKATADGARAYGEAAEATEQDAVALGTAALAKAAGSTAIGPGASVVAGATAGVALGSAALVEAAGLNGFAGPGGTVSASRGVAVGNGAVAGAAGGVAMGPASVVGATGTGSTALAGGVAGGASALASGENCTTVGRGGIALGAAFAAGDAAKPLAQGQGAMASGAPDATGTGHRVDAWGQGSRAHGQAVRAVGDYSEAKGNGAQAENRGEWARAAGHFTSGGSTQFGSAQVGTVHALIRTTAAGAVTMTPGAGATTWTLDASTAYEATIRVVARDEVSGDRAAWEAKVVVKNAGGAATFDYQAWFDGGAIAYAATAVQNVRVYVTPAGTLPATTDVQIANVGAAINLNVVGAVGRSIRWSARIDYVAVGQA